VSFVSFRKLDQRKQTHNGGLEADEKKVAIGVQGEKESA